MATNSTDTSHQTVSLDQAEVIKPDVPELHDRYRLTYLLAESAYAEVYEAVDSDYSVVAMKIQKVREDIQELAQEFAIYQQLLFSSRYPIPVTGIPWIYGYSKSNGLEYLVMERLGKSLEEIVNNFDRRQMTKKDVLMIGIQVVRRLQYLHKNGVIHRDIKPANLLMGIGPNTEKTVYLLDFGTAIIVEDWDNYDYDSMFPFVGTEYFAAAEALLHGGPTRRGDMESLCYTLSCLAHGDLPWLLWDLDTGRKLPYREMARQRVACKTESLCEGFPALEEFAKTVLQMPRKNQPDYESLITTLEVGLAAQGTTNDGDFEWLTSQTQDSSCNREVQHEKQENEKVQQKTLNDHSTKQPTSTLAKQKDLQKNCGSNTFEFIETDSDHVISSPKKSTSVKSDALRLQGEYHQRLQSSTLQLNDLSRNLHEFFIVNEVPCNKSKTPPRISKLALESKSVVYPECGGHEISDTSQLSESLTKADRGESRNQNSSHLKARESSSRREFAMRDVSFQGTTTKDTCNPQERQTQEAIHQDYSVRWRTSGNEDGLPKNDDKASELKAYDLFLLTISLAGYLNYSLRQRNHMNGRQSQPSANQSISKKSGVEEIEKARLNSPSRHCFLNERQGSGIEQRLEPSKTLSFVESRRDEYSEGIRKRQPPVPVLDVLTLENPTTTANTCEARTSRKSGSERTRKRAYVKRISKNFRHFFSGVIRSAACALVRVGRFRC